MTEVNRERVQLLVDALLSGEYAQGFGVLERIQPDGKVEHCCLGVACRVAIANGDVSLSVFQPKAADTNVYFDGQSGTLPTAVQHWYGFDSENPRLIDDEYPRSDSNWNAIDMNDNRHESFALIGQRFKLRYVDDTDEARAETRTEIDRLEAKALIAALSIQPESTQ